MKFRAIVGMVLLMVQPLWAAEESVDKREVLQLSDSERNFVLTEMREFVGALHAINQALANNDRETASKHAAKVGMHAAHGMPKDMMQKLPAQFRQFGMATHRAFDELATNLKDLDDPKIIFGQLAGLMGNCLSCHAIYQIR